MSSLKGRIIRPSLGYGKVTDDAFQFRVNAVEKGMDHNPAYPNSPVTPTAFKAAIDAYAVAMAAAADGSKKAIADRKKKREDLTIMMRLLGHYVEVACNGDMATFLSSGFEAASPTHKQSQPLTQPSIAKIDQGATGQLFVTVKVVPKARNYDLKFAPQGTGGTPGPSTLITVPSAKKPVAINGLASGTIYGFQVRAYGKLGYTGWSDVVTRMCI